MDYCNSGSTVTSGSTSSWTTKATISSYRTRQMILHYMVFVIYFASTNGCCRRYDPSDSEASELNGFASSTTPDRYIRQFECLAEEIQVAGCFNDGACFVTVPHGNARVIHCRCTPEWTGDKCENKHVDPDHWGVEDSGDRTPYVTKVALLVSVGLSAIVFVAIVIVAVAIILRRRQRHAEEIRKKKSEERIRLADIGSESPRTVTSSSNSHQHQHQQQQHQHQQQQQHQQQRERLLVMPVSSV